MPDGYAMRPDRRTSDDGISDHLLTLADRVTAHDCVFFLGSGVSSTYRDPSGITWDGGCTGGELLQRLREQHRYLAEAVSLAEALSIIVESEGPKALGRVAEDAVGRLRKSLPAHKLIAKLPQTAIITTNWDVLMEDALDEAGVSYHRIVNDRDVASLLPSKLPLIKLHGSVDSPSSVKGTYEDMLEYFSTHPLIASFVKTICANRTLLFLGYGLSDLDFIQLFHSTKRELGGFYGSSFAVQAKSSPHESRRWRSTVGIDIVESDVTEFLEGLYSAWLLKAGSATLQEGASDAQQIFLRDPMLRRFFWTRGLPTPTHVLDAVIEHSLLALGAGNVDPGVLRAKLEEYVNELIQYRPNYSILWRLRDDLLPGWFGSSEGGPARPEDCRKRVAAFRAQWHESGVQVAKAGASLIREGDRILTFSQSTRVVAVIRQWLDDNPPPATVSLLVAETRAKCPRPFQDAVAFIQGLDRTRIISRSNPVAIQVVPDGVIYNCFSNGMVSKVFLGADKIVWLPSGDISITNVTGTAMIARAAMEFGIPVYVVAEELKIVDFRGSGPQPDPRRRGCSLETSGTIPHSEERLYPTNDPTTDAVFADWKVRLFNPGYDDISARETRVTIVTESRKISL